MQTTFLVTLYLGLFACSTQMEHQEVKSCYVIGHRGAPEYGGENTVFGFNKALELGADGFELDLVLTKDNQLAVLHDFELTRLIGEAQLKEIFPEKGELNSGNTVYPVNNFSLEELQQLKVTFPSPGEERYDYRDLSSAYFVPSYDEALNFFAERIKEESMSDKIIYIEIKTNSGFTSAEDYRMIVERLYEGLSDNKLLNKRNQVWIQSFDYNLMNLIGEDPRFDAFTKTQLGFGKIDPRKALLTADDMRRFLNDVIVKRNLQNFHFSKVWFYYFYTEHGINVAELCQDLDIDCHLYTFRDHQYRDDYDSLNLSDENVFENPEDEVKFFVDKGVKAVMSDNVLSALEVCE